MLYIVGPCQRSTGLAALLYAEQCMLCVACEAQMLRHCLELLGKSRTRAATTPLHLMSHALLAGVAAAAAFHANLSMKCDGWVVLAVMGHAASQCAGSPP